jgi:hypothetical protein
MGKEEVELSLVASGKLTPGKPTETLLSELTNRLNDTAEHPMDTQTSATAMSNLKTKPSKSL